MSYLPGPGLGARRRSFRIGLLSALLLAPGWVALAMQLVVASPAQAACAALPSGQGTATFSVTIPSTGTYRFWAHEYSPSANVNGFYLQVADAGACQITVGDSASIPVGQFTWIDYQNATASSKINLSLTSGSHTVVLAGLDTGVGVDKVMFVSDLSCVPTGDGSNCTGAAATPTPAPTTPGATPTPSPTVIVPPSSGGSTTTGGSTPVSGTVQLPKATKNTTYLLDGKPVTGDQIDTTKLSDGQHTLEVVQTDDHGNKQIKAQPLLVKNHSSWLARLFHVTDQQAQVLAWALGAGLLILLAIGVFALWRRRPEWFSWLPGGGRTSAVGLSAQPSDTPPPATMVYPDQENDRS